MQITCLNEDKYDIYVIRNAQGKQKGDHKVLAVCTQEGGSILVRTECNMGGGGV